MPNENKLIVRSNIIVLVIVAVIGMMLFFVNDPYGLKLILLLACIIWAKPFAFLNRTGIDRIVFLLWVYDIILCFTSINTFASVRVVRNSTTLYFAYLLLRQVMEYPKSVRLLKQSICIVMGVALLLSLLSFFIFRRSVLDAGFEDTYSFRFLFLPLGHNTNEWTTVLLGFAGLSLVLHRSGNTGVRWLTYVLLTLSWVATWLSFSRGAFMASGILILLLLGVLQPIKEKLKLLVVVLLSVGTVSLFCSKEVMTTLSMNKTASQRQSTQGRMNATCSALNVFPLHLWFGAGTGNYTLAMDKELNQDTTQAYTTFAPNWVVQMLIEKGVIGLGLSVWLLACIVVQLWKARRNKVCVIAGCALWALALKEMTLSTLLSAPISVLLACVLLVYIQQRDELSLRWEDASGKNRINYAAMVVCCLCSAAIECFIIRHLVNTEQNEKAVFCLQKGEYEEAGRLLEGAGKTVPGLINEGIMYMNRFKDTSREEYLQQAGELLSEAQRKQPEDVHIGYLLAELDLLGGKDKQVLAALQELAGCYPRNVLYRYKLYRLLYSQGQQVEAKEHLKEAVLLSPRILGMEDVRMLEKTDSCFYHSFVGELLLHHPQDTDMPSDFARYGFITYFLGRTDEAEYWLSQAVAEMPNLSIPWCLLGKIRRERGENEEAERYFRKYKLLTLGAFSGSKGLTDKALKLTFLQEKDLFQSYGMKFREWYGCPLITLQ